MRAPGCGTPFEQAQGGHQHGQETCFQQEAVPLEVEEDLSYLIEREVEHPQDSKQQAVTQRGAEQRSHGAHGTQQAEQLHALLCVQPQLWAEPQQCGDIT